LQPVKGGSSALLWIYALVAWQHRRQHKNTLSQYHPDKLMGQGVPEDMITVATEQAQEVQVAYDLITKSRMQ